ncbi:MAG: PilZ domain-containing protein [Novosphingobium sp.]|jgi:hypothetical protein
MTYQSYGESRADLNARANRAEVSLTCEVRQGTRPWTKVKLQDISESGFRIEWRPGFFENQQMYIRIPGLELLVANLRWKREGWIGCEFTNRLYPPIFDHIVRQSLLEG